MREIPKPVNEFIVSDNDKILVNSIFQSLEEAKKHTKIPRHVEMNDLSKVLDTEEISLVERVFKIDPSKYGINNAYVGVEPVPEQLIRIEPQPFLEKGQPAMTKAQDIPVATFGAFVAMATAMKADTNRPLLITDSYRTSAEQALVFLAYLRMHDYNILQTIKRVAIPGYSEHGTPSNLALDLQNIDGLPSDENPVDFEDTIEYEWLIKNAQNFDFRQSYPKNNPQGMMFEPWHWRHMPSQNKFQPREPNWSNL